jgi:hypothetical protein
MSLSLTWLLHLINLRGIKQYDNYALDLLAMR